MVAARGIRRPEDACISTSTDMQLASPVRSRFSPALVCLLAVTVPCSSTEKEVHVMIRLSANVMKKVPVDGIDFSSRSASAGIEVEVASGATGEELRQRLGGLYVLLEAVVDEQLGAATPARKEPGNPPRQAPNTPKRTGNTNGREATEAQLRAISAIAADHGLSKAQIADLIQREFGVGSATELSVRQASSLIDTLKNNAKE